MDKIKVQDSVGTILIYDMTQIIPGVIKGLPVSQGACRSGRGYSCSTEHRRTYRL